MNGVLVWLDAHQVFAVAITTIVGLTVSALFKGSRRLWALALHHVGRGLRWIGSYRIVRKDRVRPKAPPFIKPVRWAATLGPKVNTATLRNKASGVARNVQIDDGYNLKVIGDAQWNDFPGEGVFECQVNLTSTAFYSVRITWRDELEEPHREEIEVTTALQARYTVATRPAGFVGTL